MSNLQPDSVKNTASLFPGSGSNYAAIVTPLGKAPTARIAGDTTPASNYLTITPDESLVSKDAGSPQWTQAHDIKVTLSDTQTAIKAHWYARAKTGPTSHFVKLTQDDAGAHGNYAVTFYDLAKTPGEWSFAKDDLRRTLTIFGGSAITVAEFKTFADTIPGVTAASTGTGTSEINVDAMRGVTHFETGRDAIAVTQATAIIRARQPVMASYKIPGSTTPASNYLTVNIGTGQGLIGDQGNEARITITTGDTEAAVWNVEEKRLEVVITSASTLTSLKATITAVNGTTAVSTGTGTTVVTHTVTNGAFAGGVSANGVGEANYLTVTVDDDIAQGAAGNRVNIVQVHGTLAAAWDGDSNTLTVTSGGASTLAQIKAKIDALSNKFSSVVTGTSATARGALEPIATRQTVFTGGENGVEWLEEERELRLVQGTDVTLARLKVFVDGLRGLFTSATTGTATHEREDAPVSVNLSGGADVNAQSVVLSAARALSIVVKKANAQPGASDLKPMRRAAGRLWLFYVPAGYRLYARSADATASAGSAEIYTASNHGPLRPYDVQGIGV